MTAKLAAKFTTTIAQMQERREAGASGLEYAGMVIVAALIVTAVYGALSGAEIGTKMTEKVNEILNGS